MKIVFFCHSLVSDWNNGNAHFLRGVASALVAAGHRVSACEPREGWSLANLRAETGEDPVRRFQLVFPGLRTHFYDPDRFEPDAFLAGADLVVVHEWNDPRVVRAIGEHRARHGDYRLLFHDTHHRSVTRPEEMAAFDLTHYDGALVFGEVLRDVYRERGLAARTFTWHEAADTRVFWPLALEREGDLVWVGNWGDEERSKELHEFLVEPVRALKLKATVHGVRYPADARATLRKAGIRHHGYVANDLVPALFAQHRVTVHVPRRPYVEALPGIPTIRVFEALACGIPLVSAPWDDVENLFEPGSDFLVARNGWEMREMLEMVLNDADLAASLVARGLEAIRRRHTCDHRADELLRIHAELEGVRVGGARSRPAVAGGRA